MTTPNFKITELEDKENSFPAPFPNRKEKSSEETLSNKKIALHDTTQPNNITAEEEAPTSPQDSKLMGRKREMQRKGTEGVSLKLNYC